MHTSPRREGAQPGNQNARSHGLFSRTNPPDPDQLRAAARDALLERNTDRIRQIARAFAFHGDRETARRLRLAASKIAAGQIVTPTTEGEGIDIDQTIR